MNVYLLICVVPERKQFVRKGVNRTEKKHTPCTLFSFNGGRQRPSKVTGRGGRAEETPCQTTCAIASGPGFASTAGKQHGNMG